MDDTRLQTERSKSTAQQAHSPRPDRAARRRMVVAMAVGGFVSLSSVGCAGKSPSLASMNPFGSAVADSTTSEGANKLASTGEAISKTATSTTTATKNVFAKTGDRIAGFFGRNTEEGDDNVDPLSLDHKPEKLEPEVFVANGQLWESTGNMTKAMESYTKALEAEPDNAKALTSIARLHFREGNHPQSAEFFQKAIAQDPNNAALYNDLGLTLSKLGQHGVASQTLQRALQLAPGTSRYANNLASVHFESGETDQAYKVLAENNKEAVAHFNMAFLHYKKGQTDLAKSHLTQTLAHEGQASSDPATKRAIDRSREMLAQLSPGTTVPGGVTPSGSVKPTDQQSTPTENMPGDIGPAAGPSAVIAANPAHRGGTSSPQVLGQLTPPSTQPVVPGQAKPVSYQDPRSFMSPNVPDAAPATSSMGQPPKAPATLSGPTTMVKQPAETPATPSAQGGFNLPSGFQLP